MVEKIKDIFNITRNKTNKQISYSLKKKKLKELNLSENSILNINLPLKKKFIKQKEMKL